LSRIILANTGFIKPLYTIDGHDVPVVSTLDYLAGFRGSKPVRIGNDATLHHQTDAYGEAMLSIYPLFFDERVIRKDDERLWACVEMLVKLAIEKFEVKDNGIWEIGDRPDHYTFSKLLCWVAVDRGCKIAYELGKNASYRKWNTHRKHMRHDILTRAWNPDINAYTQAYGGTDLDASTLLMAGLGIIDPKDPRMLATIQRSEELLMIDGLMFRYTNHDELGKPENAFTLCTFWFIDALALSGQKRKARKYFEQVLTYGNHLGLFSEHINQKTGEMTGNFPQGYTHVAIINTAMLLADAKF
jgi:alpha,alpha-trehalase